MKIAMRTLALGTFLFVLAVTGVLACPAIAEDDGTDVWALVEFRTRMAQSEAQSRTIDRENECVRRRIAIKHEIVHDVVIGRLTFEEAALKFAELNRVPPGSIDHVRKRFRGNTDEECARWQLAAHMRGSVDPAAQAMGEVWECILTGRE